jgi:hypothetical protein
MVNTPTDDRQRQRRRITNAVFRNKKLELMEKGCISALSYELIAELIARAFAGQPGGLTLDDVLDNIITLTCLRNTAISSARLLSEEINLSE